MDKNVAAETFNALGAHYEEAYGHLPEQLAALKWLAARLPQGARVLDIGSGTGKPVADTLVRAGFEVTGIDVSSTMVELARSQVPGARFELQDLRDFQPPPGGFQAVCAFFPLLQMDRADLEASLERIAGWLAPGGYFIMATVPGDLQNHDMLWMGQKVCITSFTAEEYVRQLERVGLQVVHCAITSFLPASDLGELEEQLFCYGLRPGGPAVPEHALAGPYPLPEEYRGPHKLSESGWLGFEALLEREEITAMVDTLDGNSRVLDVGGGTGAGVRAIAAKLGRCTTVEPNSAREQGMRAELPGVEVLSGRAESLPLPDDSFDAVVATWVLHYTDDPAAAVAEMVRVLDLSHPEAKVVLVQGAPDNEVVGFINETCVPLAGEQPDHQGLLLATAARELAAAGLEDIAFYRAGARMVVEGPDPAETAAGVLADFWYTGHPRNVEMRRALQPVLAAHFAAGHSSVSDDAVLLVARPRRRATHQAS